MSLLRAAASRSLLHSRLAFAKNARWNASDAHSGKKSSNLPLFLMVGGCAGLGTYIYFDKFAVQKSSPLDPEKWIDLKLKKVLPYNHNTARYLSNQCVHDNEVSM